MISAVSSPRLSANGGKRESVNPQIGSRPESRASSAPRSPSPTIPARFHAIKPHATAFGFLSVTARTNNGYTIRWRRKGGRSNVIPYPVFLLVNGSSAMR